MRWILNLALLPALAGAAPQFEATSPETTVTLVELYTSEGCSSCPPADRWLRGLRADPRLWRKLVPIAFHVDYWDDLGWADRFATPQYSARQRAYRTARAISSVYTPGLVVHGAEWRGWFARERLALESGRPGVLSATVHDNRLRAEFRPIDARAEAIELHVAVLGFGLASAVDRGENRGRKLEHDFTVIAYRRAPMHREAGRYLGTLAVPQPHLPAPERALAAWVSAAGEPRPIQALGGWLPQ